jgi:hypothetical protein
MKQSTSSLDTLYVCDLVKAEDDDNVADDDDDDMCVCM